MSEKVDLADMATRHADLILRAAGSGLRYYMEASRKAILLASMDAIDEAYRAGAAVALAKTRESRLTRSAS